MSYRPRASLLSGLFLLSCGMLLFEVTLTRILSLFLSYHYTFLVVSGAVLGLGVGGLLIRTWRWAPLLRANTLVVLGMLATATGLIAMGALALLWAGLLIPHPLVYMPLALLPFVPAGMALSRWHSPASPPTAAGCTLPTWAGRLPGHFWP